MAMAMYQYRQGGQSQCRIQFILPVHKASHLKAPTWIMTSWCGGEGIVGRRALDKLIALDYLTERHRRQTAYDKLLLRKS